jgi:small subunit ribosomal protein S5
MSQAPSKPTSPHAFQEDRGGVNNTTIGVYRTSATVKGGRRFSFGALVVAGDRQGRVGYGYGKSKEVPLAVEKAEKYAKNGLFKVPMTGGTIPHTVEGSFGPSKVRLIPASPGTGVVAGSTVRSVLEVLGITDCLTKCYGSTNAFNVVKAIFDGLKQLKTREEIASGRGITIAESEIEHKIEAGKKFMPASKGEKMKGPTNTIGQERRGGPRGPRRDAAPAADSGAAPAGDAPKA